MKKELKIRIEQQLEKCYDKYGEHALFHEAMSVLREEFEELWQECKKKELDFEAIENEIIDNLVVLLKMYRDIVKQENRR